MHIEQRTWSEADGWTVTRPHADSGRAQLVLAFGATAALHGTRALAELRAAYPAAHLLACSTAGEIRDVSVLDESVVATAIHFAHTRVRTALVSLGEVADAMQAGRHLARALDGDGLAHVFVLSDGLRVNGSALVRGLADHLPAHVGVTGGLAGDGWQFGRTVVALDDVVREGVIAAVGLYGDRLQVGYASVGGWSTFGPDRLVTRSRGNVLYELDGRPALELYRTYLGPYAANLPSTGLLFPLSLRTEYEDTGIVRTVLGIDDATGSMTFAGDVPEGTYIRLMNTSFARLVDGATGAARATRDGLGAVAPELAILISCAGRKMVLKQRTEEEVEAVREVLGPQPALTGFYSYGEISPFTRTARCELHNQTMTVTALAEA